MQRHLVMRLASPLIAFGGETIDSLGVIRDFPALSMVTGLLANALGWERGAGQQHNRLQQRLKVGCALAPGGQRIQDFQTAQLGKDDRAWTTWGVPEERAGGAAAYSSPHLRWRDYHADLCAWVVLALRTAEESPTLEDIAAALDRPMRPLFIGRKPCLPAGRLLAGWQEAPDVCSALQAIVTARASAAAPGWQAQWPDGEGSLPGDRLSDICDERNWVTGLHGGWRPVRQALLFPAKVSA